MATTTPDLSPLTVAARFSGPPGSANGGWVAGALAARVLGVGAASLGRAATVTLRQPPPLGARQQVSTAQDVVVMTFGGAVIAEAAPASLDVAPVEPVSVADAAEAMTQYAGLTDHPFPTCFTCGTRREAPDGLGLQPGPVAGRPHTTATRWFPDASLLEGGEVSPHVVWAALDCPGGWTVDLVGRPMVLGRITAQLDALPLVGEACLVMGRLLDHQGRKATTATTVYDGDGRVLARATAVWVAVDPRLFGRS